jgi:Uma2 family endonuclease
MSLTLPDLVAAESQAVLEPLDIDQYYRRMETGVIVEGSPIELIDGLLVRKDRRDRQGDIMTIGTRHSAILHRLARHLRQSLSEEIAYVREQQPLTVGPRNVPEPDICVAIGHFEVYADHHPEPDEVALVIEVADSSLGWDLGRKQELYRDAGIPEYWVVNLQDEVIEVFRGPAANGWREHLSMPRGQVIEVLICGQSVVIVVDEVLGDAR